MPDSGLLGVEPPIVPGPSCGQGPVHRAG